MSQIARVIQDGATTKPKRSTIWFLRNWAGRILIVLVIGLVTALLNNNYSFRRTSREALDLRLDSAIDNTLNWIKDHALTAETNEALVYMIADMERMNDDRRLRAVLDDFQTNPKILNPFLPLDRVWPRIVDPNASVPTISAAELRGWGFELRWDAHAMAPHQIQLSEEDRADMFSPTKYSWGKRDHQLLALEMYRHFNGSSDELDRTINHLSEKVAFDAHWDIRITDFYFQRSAFVLGAGRPDLIRRRWIERILEHQLPDGSWNCCWYGWCRGIFEFDLKGTECHGHSTIQAAWALYMLKYRYHSWIEQHYP